MKMGLCQVCDENFVSEKDGYYLKGTWWVCSLECLENLKKDIFLPLPSIQKGGTKMKICLIHDISYIEYSAIAGCPACARDKVIASLNNTVDELRDGLESLERQLKTLKEKGGEGK